MHPSHHFFADSKVYQGCDTRAIELLLIQFSGKNRVVTDDLRFENGLFDRARQRTTGSGSITMDRGGFVGRVRLSPWFTETRTGGNLSFRAARG